MVCSRKDKPAIKLELDGIADRQPDRAAEIAPASVRGQTVERIFQPPEDRRRQYAGNGIERKGPAVGGKPDGWIEEYPALVQKVFGHQTGSGAEEEGDSQRERPRIEVQHKDLGPQVYQDRE